MVHSSLPSSIFWISFFHLILAIIVHCKMGRAFFSFGTFLHNFPSTLEISELCIFENSIWILFRSSLLQSINALNLSNLLNFATIQFNITSLVVLCDQFCWNLETVQVHGDLVAILILERPIVRNVVQKFNEGPFDSTCEWNNILREYF